MNKDYYQEQFGQWYNVGSHKQQSALDQLTQRLEHLMPVEMIKLEQVKSVIRRVDAQVDRSLSPEEARQLLESVKAFLLSAVDGMEKYEVRLSDLGARGADHG